MRLTLRTMLAYLDDVLSESDAHDLGQKIESSDFATGLVHRIRNTISRLRLSSPELLGSDSMDDPNTVAEFIDSALTPEKEQEFEKVCLQSDKHLAEVASSHQVLTMVLGTPARVSSSLRERVYRQAAASSAVDARASTLEHRQASFSGADVTDADLAPEDIGLVDIKRPRTVVDSRTALAEFGQRRTIWPIAAAVLLGFLLTGGFLVAMGPLDGRHPLAGLLGLRDVTVAQGDGETADELAPQLTTPDITTPDITTPDITVPDITVPDPATVPDVDATPNDTIPNVGVRQTPVVLPETIPPRNFQPTVSPQLPTDPNLAQADANSLAINDIESQFDQAVGAAPAKSEFEAAVGESGASDSEWVLPADKFATEASDTDFDKADFDKADFDQADFEGARATADAATADETDTGLENVPLLDVPGDVETANVGPTERMPIDTDEADNALDSQEASQPFATRIVDPLVANTHADLSDGDSLAFDTSPRGVDSNDPPLPGAILPGSSSIDEATAAADVPSDVPGAFPDSETADAQGTAPSEAFPASALDSQHPQTAPDTPTEVGRFLSDDQILLYWDDESSSWLRLPPRTAFGTGHRLRMLQNHRTQLLLSPGNIQLNSRGNTEITVAPPQNGQTPTLDVRFGRFLLSASGQSHSSVTVRARDRTITIEFTEPNSEAACQVQPVLLPGLDPRQEPAHYFVKIWVTQGSAKISEIGGDDHANEQQVEAGQMYAFADHVDARVLAFRTVPSWLNQRIDPIDRDAAVELEPLLPSQRDVILSLAEAADSRRTDVRSWALRHLVSLGEYRRAATLFSIADRKHQHTWPALFDEFRAVIARDSESASSVQKIFLDLYGADGPRLYRMLLGYDNDQLKAGAADQLVDELASPRVEFRVLAILNLKRITAKTLTYSPVLGEKFRATKVTRWRNELKKGKVLLAPTVKEGLTAPDQQNLADWDGLMTSLVP